MGRVISPCLGVVVFAISGALIASRKRMDIVGFILMACLTGIPRGVTLPGYKAWPGRDYQQT